MDENCIDHDRKRKANLNINRLWIIDKYEADYDLVLKLYWPKIKKRIEEKNWFLVRTKWETEKKSAIDAALVNEFIIDTVRINQQPLAIP